MPSPVFFTEYDPPPDKGVDCSGEPSLTKQSFKDECDINITMERYVPSVNANVPPMFGDFSDAVDYQAAQNIIIEARNAFEALPSKVRERFKNDPRLMLEFVNDPKNQAEAIELGMATPKVEVAPMKVTVVSSGVPGAEPPAPVVVPKPA